MNYENAGTTCILVLFLFFWHKGHTPEHILIYYSPSVWASPATKPEQKITRKLLLGQVEDEPHSNAV